MIPPPPYMKESFYKGKASTLKMEILKYNTNVMFNHIKLRQ